MKIQVKRISYPSFYFLPQKYSNFVITFFTSQMLPHNIFLLRTQPLAQLCCNFSRAHAKTSVMMMLLQVQPRCSSVSRVRPLSSTRLVPAAADQSPTKKPTPSNTPLAGPCVETSSINQRSKKGVMARILAPYTTGLAKSPFSYVLSFLAVHQTTALLSLAAVWSLFTHFNYTPMGIPDILLSKGLGVVDIILDWTGWAAAIGGFKIRAGGRVLMQGAAAYAVVKMMFPLRLGVSIALMPWVARWVFLPFFSLFKRSPKASKQIPSAKSKPSNPN